MNDEEEKNRRKKFSRKKMLLVCLKGAPLSPSNTLWLISANGVFLIFFFNINKKCIWYQLKIFSPKIADNKKKKLTTRSSNYSISAKFFPMLVKMLYFGRIINQKTYLKWARTEFFSSIIGLGIILIYEFEVCFSVHCTIK